MAFLPNALTSLPSTLNILSSASVCSGRICFGRFCRYPFRKNASALAVRPWVGTIRRIPRHWYSPEYIHASRRNQMPLCTQSTAQGSSGSMSGADSAAECDEEGCNIPEASEPTTKRLQALRDELRLRGVDAFIVPSGDPHASEYSAACFARREYLSNFSGSAGTAVVTKDEALLWTDGRYFLQAAQQLDMNWKLMKFGLPDTPSIQAYLAKSLPAGSKIGIDPLVHSIEDARKLKDTLGSSQKELISLDQPNPVDVVWGSDRPALPRGVVRVHGIRYAGVETSAKIDEIAKTLVAKSCDALLVSTLDEVCWLLNIRGDDVPHCPVVLSYALVTVKEGTTLYVDESKLNDEVRQALQHSGIHLKRYTDVVDDVRSKALSGFKFWLDPASTSLALCKAAGDSVYTAASPIVLSKARKNDAELKGMKEAHLKDGVALCKFLHWLECHVNGPDGEISELDAANRLEKFRAEQSGFLATSFDTISGSGPNGAIIHYSPQPETCRMVNSREVYLLDSGGQYCDGTTDVTRTMHLGGSASLHERECFTRVLQGHIGIDTAVFPQNTTGFMIDSLARRPLWSVGLDYRHGTGHGVGACLNVHEGPHSISPRIGSNKVALMPGMIVSNEPGYYEDGSFGIRIENLLTVVAKSTPHQFAGTPFFGFECLTFVPVDKSMIAHELLSPAEIQWLDSYHAQVWAKLSPRMHEGAQEREWLWRKTQPLMADISV